MHVIAAKAVSFKEAMEPGFKEYQRHTVENARRFAGDMMERGYEVVSGGTDNHLFLISLVSKAITGKDAEAALGEANITVNKNAVPDDPQSPFVTSGIRVGTPAVTTRGFGTAEMDRLADWLADVLDDMEDMDVRQRVRQEVLDICRAFPVYR
jgi:glycine hydroxymethyltransferase